MSPRQEHVLPSFLQHSAACDTPNTQPTERFLCLGHNASYSVCITPSGPHSNLKE